MNDFDKKYNRFPFLLLPYTMRYMAIPNEIFMDYEAGILYYKDNNNKDIPLSDSGFIDHIQDYDNPHLLTAKMLQLENILNIRQASKEEFDKHTSNYNNPHKVTKKHIGLDKVPNVMQASKIELDNLKNKYLDMMTEVEELLSRPIYKKMYELIIDTVPEEASARVFYNDRWNEGKIHNVPAGEYEYEVYMKLPERKYNLIIHTSPHESKVEVFYDGKWNMSKTHMLPSGDYDVRVSSIGYKDFNFITTISNSDKMENIILVPLEYTLIINTIPEDSIVKVYYNGKLNEGKTHKIPNGTYPIEISRDGYDMIQDNIVIFNGNKTIDLVLEESKYLLNISTTPTDCKVEVFYDGKWNLGNTHNLLNGDYQIRVSRVGYVEVAKTTTIMGKDKIENIILEPIKYELSINTDPLDCKIEVYYNNKWNIGNTHSIPNGSYQVKVSKIDYDTKEITVDILDSDKSVNVELDITKYNLTVNTSPIGAKVKVKINNIWEESKDNKFMVVPGNYEIEASMDGYKTNTTIAVINRSDTVVNMVLNKLYSLTINTIPLEATVKVKIDGIWVDGKEHEVQSGSYEIQAYYDGYYMYTDIIIVSGNKDINIQLLPFQYILTINTTPLDATVMVYYNNTWNLGKVHSIPNGAYTINISKNGYFSQDHTITIMDSNLTKSYELIEEKYTLTVDTIPNDCKVEVYYNNTWNLGNNHQLANGVYNVKVSKSGYKEQIRTIIINNTNKNESFILVENKYYLTINTIPSDAISKIYVNGEWITSKYIELLNGSYNVQVSKQYYDTIERNVVINNNNKTETFTLQISQNLNDDIYLGKVNNITTANNLNNILNIGSLGTDLYVDDITWLQFITEEGKELLIADRNIKNIKYSELETAGIVKTISSGYNPNEQGKIISINGQQYKCRLLTGGNTNPATAAGGEWDRLITRFTPDNSDSNWKDIYSWCQEVRAVELYTRIIRGFSSASMFNRSGSNATAGFRPVLERI